jgi:hypothetical protein
MDSWVRGKDAVMNSRSGSDEPDTKRLDYSTLNYFHLPAAHI